MVNRIIQRFSGLVGASSLVIAAAFTLVTGTAGTVAAQSTVGGTGPAPQPQQENLASPPPPFTKFNVFTSGSVTTGSTTNCPDITCYSGSCTSCETFSGLKINGLAGATLSGELLFEAGYATGNCSQVHGNSTATAKTFTIKFGLQGWACYDLALAVDDLQFTGNYVVLGGTGSYGHAAGTGSFTTDYANFLETVTRSMSFDGVIQKAK
jgi:hypothetical protein